MIYALFVINILTISCLVWVIKRHFFVLDKLDDLNERIEESLDIMDSSYGRMSRLLETPMLFDDPIAIEMVQSAKESRDALLLIANKIVDEKNEFRE